MSDIIKLLDAIERGASIAKEHEDEIREFVGSRSNVDEGTGSEPTATYTETDDGIVFVVYTGDDTIQSLDDIAVKQSRKEITIEVKGIDFVYDISDMEIVESTSASVNNGVIQMEVIGQ